MLENNQTDLRKLVGRVSNDETWGALIETEETALKDAISADIKEQYSISIRRTRNPSLPLRAGLMVAKLCLIF